MDNKESIEVVYTGIMDLNTFCDELQRLMQRKSEVPIESLSNLNVCHILDEMVRRYPTFVFGQCAFKHKDDMWAGQFLIERNQGEIRAQCPMCPAPDILWSNRIDRQCYEHCDHSLQQCRGMFCSCTCQCCVENGLFGETFD